jgi:hypothetical protein
MVTGANFDALLKALSIVSHTHSMSVISPCKKSFCSCLFSLIASNFMLFSSCSQIATLTFEFQIEIIAIFLFGNNFFNENKIK